MKKPSNIISHTENINKFEPEKEKVNIFIFSKAMLDNYDDSTLDRMLIIYKVDTEAAAKKKKLTKQHKIDLLMETQKIRYDSTGSTPKGLERIIGDYSKQAAKVFVNLGVTLNMGNYESLKVDGGLTVSVGATQEEIGEAVQTFYEVASFTQVALEKKMPELKLNFWNNVKQA